MMLIDKLKTVATGLLLLAASVLGGGLLVIPATAGPEMPPLRSSAVPNEAQKGAPPAGAGGPAEGKAAETEEPAKLQGTWKLTEFISGGERNRYLIQMESGGAKPGAKLVVAKQSPRGTYLTGFRVEGKSIHFIINSTEAEFTFDGRLTSDGKKVVGMYRIRMPRLAVPLPGGDNGAGMLTPTDARTIDAKDEMVQPLDLNKAMRMTGRERLAAFQELLKKDPESPAVLWVVHQALRLSAREKDVGFDYKELVKRAETVASAGGPALERREALILAELLANIGQTDLALEQARRAEDLHGKNATLAEQAGVLTLLEAALKAADKEDELKDVRGRLGRIEAELDKRYLASVPIKPTPATMHPKNGRVVVLELFNVGAEVPLSAGPEAAFDALLETYPPGDVVLLQYHPQIGLGVDPLSSPDGDARWNYYRRVFADPIKSSLGPTAIFNGKEPKNVGGGLDVSRSRYKGFAEGLSIWFDAETGPKLRLTATEKGGKIDIQATVNGLEEPGKDKRLRLVLVEKSVHYAGASGSRIHNCVVRAIPGGPAGFTLKESNSKQTATVDLAGLKRQLADYLEAAYKKRPTPDREGMAGRPLPIEKRPLNLKDLKVVALVQDDKTGEILQAAEADLGAVKTGK